MAHHQIDGIPPIARNSSGRAVAAGTALIDGVPYRSLENPARKVGALLDAKGVHPNRSARSTLLWQAQAAGIGMPEVAIYDAPEINAFATGARRDASLVAVSTGLLRAMTRDEAEAVLAHEVAHVANGDMVTMALLQGVLNTFVIFLARVVGRAVDGYLNGGRDNGGGGLAYFAIVFVLDMIFGLFASMIAMWFSRRREFRADVGGAQLAGRQKMLAALERLGQTYGHNTLPKQIAAFGISGGLGHGLKRLLMSHPPLEERIQSLRNADLGESDGARQRAF